MKLKWKLLIIFGGIFIMVASLLYFKQQPQSELSLSNIKSNILNAFSQGTISPIRTQYNKYYEVLSKTGNESLYDVTFKSKQVSLGFITYYDEELKKNVSVEQFRKDEIICLEAGWDEKEIIEYKWDEKEQKEVIDNTYNYSVPSTLSFYKTTELSKQSDLTKTKANQLSATSPSNPNTFCYQANPEKDFYLKFGDNSVIVIQGKDIVSDSLLVNVTAESDDANFTHLTIDDTSAPYDSLVGYWSFDGDKYNVNGSTSYDFSEYNNDGTMVNEAIVNDTGCIYGDCLQLDGTGDYVNIPNGPIVADYPFSIVVWFKCNNQLSNQVLFSMSDTDDDSYQILTLRDPPDSDVGVLTWDVGEAASAVVTTTVQWTANTWHMVTGVWAGAQDRRVYIDGGNERTNVADSALFYAGIDNTNIGIRNRQSAFSIPFNGTIDEVMIFNTSLTAQQILDIYNNQSARFVEEGTQKVRAVNITNTTNWDNAGYNRVNLTTTFEANMQSNISARIGMMNLSVDPDGLVLYMPFEWGSAVDISGKGNDGTLQNSSDGYPTFNETRGLNETGGFEFDGYGDYVSIANFVRPTATMTTSAWIYVDDVSSDHNHIVGGDDSSEGSAERSFQFKVVQTSGVIRFLIFDSASFYYTDGSTDLEDGWHHVVGRYNGTTVTVYVDGVEEGDPTIAGLNVGDIDGGTGITIGSQSDEKAAENFNGTIDEVIIFNRSLSANEISALYGNQSAKHNIAYYTDYQNLTTVNSFTIDDEADFIFPDFKFEAGNYTNPFYTPLLLGDITLETWNYTVAVEDANPVSILSIPLDNNVTPQGVVTFECNATDDINLENVTLYIWNSSGGIINTSFTTWNGTANSTRFNHTFTFDNQTHWNCLVFDNSTTSQSDWAADNFTLIISAADTTFPNVTINTPLNQTYNTNSIVFNATALDNIEIDSCWYTLNSGVTNYTLKNTTTTADYNHTNSSVEQGSRIAQFYCNDTNNNLNNTESMAFVVDSVYPDILIIYPTNNTNITTTDINVNYTYSDVNPDSCWWSSDDGANNNSLTDCNTNITGQTWTEGLNNITVYINDSADNENKTVVTFRLDTISPDIIILSPANNSNTTDNNIEINFSASDVTLNTCWWSNESGEANNTISCGTNITGKTWDEGSNIVQVWANDSVDNLNTTTVSFTIDTIAPDISITTPSNNSNSTDTELDINYTVSFTGVDLDSCWWSNESGTVNQTLTDCNTNITGQTWDEGLNNIIVYVNDSLNNLNLTTIRFRLDTTAPSITLQNFSQQANLSFSQTMSVTDNGVGIDTYSLNSTIYFSISSTGLIQNVTNLSRIEIHYLNISVNDSLNNLASGIFYINITIAVEEEYFIKGCTTLKVKYDNLNLPAVRRRYCGGYI